MLACILLPIAVRGHPARSSADPSRKDTRCTDLLVLGNPLHCCSSGATALIHALLRHIHLNILLASRIHETRSASKQRRGLPLSSNIPMQLGSRSTNRQTGRTPNRVPHVDACRDHHHGRVVPMFSHAATWESAQQRGSTRACWCPCCLPSLLRLLPCYIEKNQFVISSWWCTPARCTLFRRSLLWSESANSSPRNVRGLFEPISSSHFAFATRWLLASTAYVTSCSGRSSCNSFRKVSLSTRLTATSPATPAWAACPSSGADRAWTDCCELGPRLPLVSRQSVELILLGGCVMWRLRDNRESLLLCSARRSDALCAMYLRANATSVAGADVVRGCRAAPGVPTKRLHYCSPNMVLPHPPPHHHCNRGPCPAPQLPHAVGAARGLQAAG